MKDKFKFFINKQQYEVAEQNLTGLQLKNLAKIAADTELYLKSNTNDGDKLIGNNDVVDIGQQGSEHFYTNSIGNDIVQIKINDNPYDIHRGRSTVIEIKNIGNVPLEYDLEQVIDGKLTPLGDNDAVTIKGGEVFLSHPKDGSSA